MMDFASLSVFEDPRRTLNVDDIRERLFSVSNTKSGFEVTVPVLYPSGSHAMVHIASSGGSCVVSDMGNGSLEADLYGCRNTYAAAAKSVCEDYGTQFDGDAIIAIRVPIAQAHSAITIVANASAQAVFNAADKASQRNDATENDVLFDRITNLFGEKNVARKVEIPGQYHKWNAHNVVKLSDRRSVIFEAVSKHQASVASKVTMFLDISNLENPPMRVSVVPSLAAMDDYVGLLSNVSNVVERGVSDAKMTAFAKSA